MNGLFYLGHLVYTKNEINQRRRRFYTAWRGIGNLVEDEKGNTKWQMRFPTHLTPLQGELGYKQAQLDMKAMTKNMRQQCKDLKAKLIWTCSGNIETIILDGKRYSGKEITYLHEAYLADEILLA